LCTVGHICNRCAGFVAITTKPNAKCQRVLVLVLCLVLLLRCGEQAKRRIEHLEESIARAQARETQIVEMSQWMSDVNDLLQTRLDADVLAGDTPKEFEVTVLLSNFFVQCSLMPFSLWCSGTVGWAPGRASGL